jgi:hypothetical protein
MKRVHLVMVTALAAGFGVCASAQEPPPMPTPGPEHRQLKLDEGTWDAIIEITPGPDVPPMTSKGIEVNTLGCGGLCLITDFKGDMVGMPFHGHGTITWDAVKKKYVGSWTDSMSWGLQLSEGNWDPVTKKFNGTMEGRDAMGNITKTRSVAEHLGEGKRVMSGYTRGPDGKEFQVLKITYTKRK